MYTCEHMQVEAIRSETASRLSETFASDPAGLCIPAPPVHTVNTGTFPLFCIIEPCGEFRSARLKQLLRTLRRAHKHYTGQKCKSRDECGSHSILLQNSTCLSEIISRAPPQVRFSTYSTNTKFPCHKSPPMICFGHNWWGGVLSRGPEITRAAMRPSSNERLWCTRVFCGRNFHRSMRRTSTTFELEQLPGFLFPTGDDDYQVPPLLPSSDSMGCILLSFTCSIIPLALRRG